MAQDGAANASPSTSVSTADLANASAQPEMLSAVRRALSTGSDAVVTAITAIATAVTQKLVGGVVGTTTNRLLKSKTVSSGSSAGSLQASGITCDNSNNLSGIGNIDLTGNVVSSGGSFYVAANGAGFSVTGANLTLGNAYNLYGYNSTSLAFVPMATVTTGNPPTLNLISTATKGGIGIASLNTNTWLQQQGFAQATLTDAATVTWNGQTQQTAKLTLTASGHALGAISNAVAGYTYILEINVGSGPYTFDLSNSAYTWPGGVVPTVSTTANATDVLSFYYDGSKMRGVIQKAFA